MGLFYGNDGTFRPTTCHTHMISQPNYSILLEITNLGMRKRLLHFARVVGEFLRTQVSKKRTSEPKSRFRINSHAQYWLIKFDQFQICTRTIYLLGYRPHPDLL